MLLFDMLYGEALKAEIESLSSPKQRAYFLAVFEDLGEFVRKYDEFLSFGEFLRMTEGN